MFEDLYDLFEQYKVDTVDRFWRISDTNRRALSGRLTMYFRDNLRDIVNLIEESQGLVFNFNEYEPRVTSLDLVTRKAIFYSEMSVALLDGSVTLFDKSGSALHSGNPQKRVARRTHASNVGVLVKMLLETEPLVKKGILVPLPGDLQASSHIAGHYNDVLDSIRTGRTAGPVIPITLDRWAIRRQIEELGHSNPSFRDLRPVCLYLPQLRGLDTETLLRLREDNYDAFIRFQRALREFTAHCASVSSETKFLDIARKVDFEVQELEQRVRSLERDRRQKGYEVCLGLALSSLTLLVSTELAAALSAFVSKKTIWDGLQYLRAGKQAINSSDYYMAYLVKSASQLPRNPGPTAMTGRHLVSR